MENYIVSARKYRPSTFRSVVGQQSLTTTLKNAIRNNKLAHAYLFCGPRGVGKTTCARIFAKTINCLTPNEDGEACNTCESCVSFNEQRSYNIHELDAASNNSVDDIRSLIEQVRIPPQTGKYKVYIIDEVHMLSPAAFNAFLKTLEEPPRYAVFILATTEKHKILPTILSRCQIYDFNRIGINDTVEYLEYVASQEHVSFEKEALSVIAQKADGGMRDALSIFDQVVSFTGGNITYQSVIENLNVLDYEYYFKLTGNFLQNKVSACLLIFNEILGKGFEGQHFVGGLTSFFRDLLVCKDPETIVLYEVGDAVKSKYQTVAQACDVNFLYKAIELSNECDLTYRASRNKRLLVELLLIRLCRLMNPQSTEDDKKKTLDPIVPDDPETNTIQTVPSQVVTTPVQTPVVPVQDSNTPSGGTVDLEILKSANSASKPRSGLSGAPVSVSLKETQSKKEEKKTEEKSIVGSTNAELPRNSFTRNDLIEKWNLYAGNIKEKIHLKNTMLNISPDLKNGEIISVSVYNPEQAQKLQEESTALVEFLRRELKNAYLVMEVDITEQENTQIAYMETDKYKLFVSKNPQLQQLVNEFRLRLD
ncbi:MAG: DNA polymerase III subunit gamma/tau [Dysgonamonadaceae bacterium]|jgi:DNA polymerase-3 subunit gamma/tau|nr:DNA polymerase III subunit gamma/tau [Dysgonamonadaceae bacterium]